MMHTGRLTSNNVIKHIDFAMLVAWITISLMLVLFAYINGGVDFDVYYAAARLTLHGGNPYDYSQLANTIVSSTGEINNPYYYAPWFTWAILPLSLIPYQIARGIWILINFLLWIFGLFNLKALINWPTAGWQRWGTYTIATIMFAWTTWGFEQVGILIFFLLSVALLAATNKRWGMAGICLALLLFKPNITGLPILAIIAWLFLRGIRKPGFFAGIAVALMLAISLIITPEWYRALIQPATVSGLSYKFSDAGTAEMVRHNTTLLDWLAANGISGSIAYVTYAIVIATGLSSLTWTIFRSKSLLQLTAIALLVNFAIIPYALFYDYSSLVLAFFFANAVLLHKPFSIWGRRALNTFALASLFIGTTISYRYWMVIALTLILVFSYIMQRTEHPVDRA